MAADASCHLAPVAAWADRIKQYRRWSSPLHYVNAVGDDPPTTCVFGDAGFVSADNVFTAIVNYTQRAVSGKGAERDEAVRFLVHYLGDMHQPLHLVGRARGGNGIHVRFDVRDGRDCMLTLQGRAASMCEPVPVA